MYQDFVVRMIYGLWYDMVWYWYHVILNKYSGVNSTRLGVHYCILGLIGDGASATLERPLSAITVSQPSNGLVRYNY